MMSVKKDKTITIIGLIDNIGGREIEVRNIIKALSQKYNVKLTSLYYMTGDSEAVKGLNCNWTNVYSELNKSNILLGLISFVLKIYHKRKGPSYFLVDNKISRKLFNINVLKMNILKNEIDKSDAVLYCGTLHLNILNEMIKYCHLIDKPIILRTTGKIKSIPKELVNLLPSVSTTLVHSLSNAVLLNSLVPNNISVIDQTSLQENRLLDLPIEKKQKLVFGYLGRFSDEKGILELLNIFNSINEKLIVAGSGPLLKQVEKLITPNITFLGMVIPENLEAYYKQIDVLIIPSLEEAGPLVGIEAMAAGKIILSTKVGAMEDRLIGTENNFWFDITKADSLKSLVKLISNKDEAQIISIRKDVRRHYLENYSVNKISKTYIEAFDKLLD